MNRRGLSLSISWREVIVIGFPLVAALVVAQVAIFGGLGNTGRSGWVGLSGLDALTPLLVTSVVLFFLFYSLHRHGEKTVRVVTSGIMLAGTLSALVIAKSSLDPALSNPFPYYSLAAPLAYLGFYFSLRYYAGSLSAGISSLLLVVSATAVGGLVGVVLPLLFTLFLLAGLLLLDIVFLDSDLLRRTVAADNYHEVLKMVTVPIGGISVGIGDIMVYSILASSALYNFGVMVAIATVSLTLVGTLFTIRSAHVRLKVAGLPIPILLGLLPIVARMLIA